MQSERYDLTRTVHQSKTDESLYSSSERDSAPFMMRYVSGMVRPRLYVRPIVLGSMTLIQSVNVERKGVRGATHAFKPLPEFSFVSSDLNGLGVNDIPEDGLEGLTGVVEGHVYLWVWIMEVSEDCVCGGFCF
jgi:hypothetical protein